MSDNVELDELRDDRSLWKSLLEHEGFKRLQRIAKGQLEGRQKERLSMQVASQEQVAHFNMSQGEERGIELFMRLPELQLELIESELEKYDG